MNFCKYYFRIIAYIWRADDYITYTELFFLYCFIFRFLYFFFNLLSNIFFPYIIELSDLQLIHWLFSYYF